MLWLLFEVLTRLRVATNIVAKQGSNTKRIDVNHNWLTGDAPNKTDKEKNKFIKVLRELGGITPCFWYIKLNTIKSGHLCSLQLEPLKVVLIWAKLRWCYYLLYFTVINDKTKICFNLIRVNQGQSGIDAFFEIELYLFYNC